MGFFDSLKTTYTYRNKSAFISFSEALLWPYRVFAGHMHVTLPDATLDQEKNLYLFRKAMKMSLQSQLHKNH